ncbi:DUF1254 domain-containing protein [Pseudomonas sp. WS 5059]|uniref:DUF1254 domain-containing protein n=1 Tax=unclassified Pseudomonas TaxID=196821 RepID=UPI001472EAF1|nr:MULTISPECIES: DUF1254 domain-containing protein [unclassified Pseudomonas]NMX60122.1 DUF1254 domain-containing protein [Pseudomonas sp. WS 5079]NMY02087.1 DUF1254 domain-containing protein [Pseudomonas sp. WS 5059]
MQALMRNAGFTLLALSASCGVGVHAQTLDTRIGPITMEGELPAHSEIAKLYGELDFQQATQSFLWALPLVSYAQWQDEFSTKLGARSGDLMVLTTYEDKLGVITANATTPYILGFVDLNETGPLVIELPPGPTAGGIGDFWQRAIIDMGQTGPDQGKGGKYLVLPPGHEPPADAGKYYLAKSQTMNVLVGFRVLDPDPAKGKALVEQFRMYPYAQRANPGKTRLLSPAGKPWSGTQPRGMAYWERLHGIIQKEPVNERDRFYMAMLASLGIEKDRPFNPNEHQRQALEQGAQMGELIAKANAFAKRFPQAQYWPDRQWDTVLNIADPSQRVTFYDQLWERSAWFYEAVTNTKGMVSKTPGLGQTYLGAYTDQKGQWLDGAKHYKLHVGANPPAKQFWSMTVYDIDSRCLIDNPQRKADLSSRQDLKKNPDGSVDLYFGPTAPKDFENNWVQTLPGKHWFSYFRLYAPTEAYFDKRWKLDDITPVP